MKPTKLQRLLENVDYFNDPINNTSYELYNRALKEFANECYKLASQGKLLQIRYDDKVVRINEKNQTSNI